MNIEKSKTKVQIKFTQDYKYEDTKENVEFTHTFKKGESVIRNLYNVMLSRKLVEVVFVFDEADCNHAILLDYLKSVSEVIYVAL